MYHLLQYKEELRSTRLVYLFHVALFIQHATRMRHIVTSFAVPLAPYFSTLSHKRHYFRGKNVIKHKMCFDYLYNFRLKHFSF
jgi:hypothetical protein